MYLYGTARGLSERAVLGGLLHASQNGAAAWGTHLAMEWMTQSSLLADILTATVVFEYIYSICNRIY